MDKRKPTAAARSRSEKRSHPRRKLCASVMLKQGDAMLFLVVGNMSASGAYLEADSRDLAAFAVGGEYDLIIFDPKDLHKHTAVTIEIVRSDDNGVGIAWSGEAAQARIAELIARLTPADT
jgi:hypothetical protein